ncbi:hypothetical protein [Sorangium sp. So ce363]|uniref:hypothetical protein n=1 Tax=Sorangium sp. So ce363 TaxID=3133304 RepID=UPI003F5DE4C0
MRGSVDTTLRAGPGGDGGMAVRLATRGERGSSPSERYRTRAAAIASIGDYDYIDNFYNLKRRHSRLAYMSPIELELTTYVAALAA